MVDLNRIDLNLLVAFDALMTERSVTRAAHRLNVKQSAMSTTLGRLRKLLGDPVLVRQGQALVATPLAESLFEPVSEALARIELVLEHRGFNPTSDHRTFNIIASDRTTLTFLHPFITALHDEAPNVRLNITPTGDDYAERLQRGLADLLLIPREVFVQHSHYPHEVLYQDRFVCAVDAANEQVGDAITLEQFSTLPYLATSSGRTPSIAEMQLDFLGVSRNTKVIAGFSLAPFLLRGGPLITLIHERLALAVGAASWLRLLEPPIELKPLTEIMVWTPRAEREPGNKWLRIELRRQATATATRGPAGVDLLAQAPGTGRN
ncbi:LysR family transcriptional regulator [Mycobacterium lentiflavum]|uniref:LysR family transcriptional regulator n=1 Tax=Mycobacterium lentiflavum TaxID=141349 RepID=A0ABY3UPT1_MYCLN|nr:LysR family transcriptional regulator [Mycobacterium lentiflavum]ULP41590.1 LysR family transcriptional regulator [Mycobacterium lentiflavum]